MVRLACIASLMLAFGFSHGQDKVPSPVSYDITCSFQLTFYPDSTNSAPKKEEFYLFINQEQSLFKSKNNYLKDSAVAAANSPGGNRQNLLSFLRDHPTDFNFSIVKRGCKAINTIDQIYHDYFSYPEAPEHLQWVLTQDTAKIAGYHCQRATAEFGERTWNAWFTETVPVNEGPYKFCGLPGLIVRLTDSKGHYDFLLNGLRQSRKELLYPVPEKATKIEKASFFKKQREYRANPIGIAEQSGVVFTSGRSEIVQRVQQRIKSSNNPVEFFGH